MSKPSKSAAERETCSQVSQSTAAWLIERTPRWLRDSSPPRNEDGTYNAKTLFAWMLERETATATGDPLLTGSDSPNLERYRKAKAELAEMDAAERRGQIADVGELCDWWMVEVAPPIRQAIEQIERLSIDAAKIIRAAVERACDAIEKRSPDDSDSGQGSGIDTSAAATQIAIADEATVDNEVG